jgi:hypothetical protein
MALMLDSSSFSLESKELPDRTADRLSDGPVGGRQAAQAVLSGNAENFASTRSNQAHYGIAALFHGKGRSAEGETGRSIEIRPSALDHRPAMMSIWFGFLLKQSSCQVPSLLFSRFRLGATWGTHLNPLPSLTNLQN